jgi:hypothetical protein
MFDLEQSITEWRRRMLAAGIKSPAPLEELESHLREEIEKQVRSGLNDQMAFAIALERIGEVAILRNEFKKAEGLKEMAQVAAKSLLRIALPVFPVIVLISTICFVSAWQRSGPFSFSFSTPNAHVFSPIAGENAPVSLEMNRMNHSGALLDMYNRFAGGRFARGRGNIWWFQSVCVMEILLFSLILAFAAYFETPENPEAFRRQRQVVWIGQLLLGFSGLLAVFSLDALFGLVLAAIFCTVFVFGLRWQSRAVIMAS